MNPCKEVSDKEKEIMASGQIHEAAAAAGHSSLVLVQMVNR